MMRKKIILWSLMLGVLCGVLLQCSSNREPAPGNTQQTGETAQEKGKKTADDSKGASKGVVDDSKTESVTPDVPAAGRGAAAQGGNQADEAATTAANSEPGDDSIGANTEHAGNNSQIENTDRGNDEERVSDEAAVISSSVGTENIEDEPAEKSINVSATGTAEKGPEKETPRRSSKKGKKK